MRIRNNFLFVTSLLVCLELHAQTLTQAQRDELFRQYIDWDQPLITGGSILPHWMADGSSFWYADGPSYSTVIYKVDPKKNLKTPFFDRERLLESLSLAVGRKLTLQGIPFSRFSFEDGEKAVRFTFEKQDYVLQLDNYSVQKVSSLTEDELRRAQPQPMEPKLEMLGAPPRIEIESPDHHWFASDRKDNVWLRSATDGHSQQLTTDGVKDFGWVVQGIGQTARWAPDSRKLAVQKIDSREVHRVPIVHWLRSEEVEWVHEPIAGSPIDQAEVYVLDIQSNHVVKMDLGSMKDQYVFILNWLPDGSELLLLKADRLLKHLELLAANPASGATRVVLTEESNTFLLGGVAFLQLPQILTFINNGKQFIWMSDRDGWRHLYLYDIQGKLIRRLTEGSFPVEQVVAVDEQKGWVYFTARAEKRLYDVNLYRVDLNGRHFTRLTEGTGQHRIQLSPSKEFFLDTNSNVDRPPVVELRTAEGRLLDVLSKANIDRLREMHWQTPEEFVVKAADQVTDLYGVLYKPADFDPGKKYPVVDCIYGGPQAIKVQHGFLGDREGQAIAQLGFIVLTVDARGTPGRGKQFQDVVYENLGRNEIPDHVAALQQLAQARPFMDLTRVGIMGHSYGGYFALRAMLMAPDIYKVGIASAPIADAFATARAIESYIGLPQDHKAEYDFASDIRLVNNLKGKLLIMIGTSDLNVPFSHVMRIADALNTADKPYSLVIFPEHDHGLQILPYWRETVRRYLEENLAP